MWLVHGTCGTHIAHMAHTWHTHGTHGTRRSNYQQQVALPLSAIGHRGMSLYRACQLCGAVATLAMANLLVCLQRHSNSVDPQEHNCDDVHTLVLYYCKVIRRWHQHTVVRPPQAPGQSVQVINVQQADAPKLLCMHGCWQSPTQAQGGAGVRTQPPHNALSGV